MDKMSSIIMVIALIIIMFGMGLSLSLADFKRVGQQPKAVILGLVNQLVILPLIGYALALWLDMSPGIAVGIMILVACPGGATSNLITHLAKGDTALSVSLTAVSSLLTIITIPLIIQFSLDTFLGATREISINVPEVIAQLFIIIIIPVSLGMLVKAKAPKFAFRMDRPVRIASAVVMVLIVVGLTIKERDNVIPYFQEAGIPTVILNLATMTIGFVTARFLKLKKPQAVSIAIESGIQNSTLAMTIATVTLGDSSLGIAAAVYSLVMFAAGFVMIFYGR